MNRKGNTVAEGVVAAGLSGALYTTSLFLPAGIMTALFSPLPLAYYTWRQTAWTAALFALLAALIPAYFAPIGGASYLVQFGLGGVLLGETMKRGLKPEYIIGAYTLLSTAAALVILVVTANAASLSPADLVDSIAAEWRKAISDALGTDAGQAPRETLVALESRLEEVVDFLAHSFFGLTVSINLLTGWLNAAWLRRLARARGAKLDNWLYWRAPDSWIWALILPGLAMLFGDGVVKMAGTNILFISVSVYFLQGLAIIQLILTEKNASPFIRIPIYALIVLYVPGAPVAVAVLGAFDMWLNFRSRVVKPPADRGNENK